MRTDLSTIVAWHTCFDASKLTGYSDGSTVTSWPDASGHSRHASVLTGTPLYRPSVASLNGQPAVQFDNVDDALNTASFTAVPVPFTVVAIGVFSGTGNRYMVCGPTAQYYVASGSAAWLVRNQSQQTGGTSDLVPHMFRAKYVTGTDSFCVDEGASVTLSGDAGAVSATQLFLGWNNSTGHGSCHIAFVGLYAGDVTTDPGWAAFVREVAARYRVGSVSLATDAILGLTYERVYYATAGDPSSIQAAIDAAALVAGPTRRCLVVIPAGTYTVTARVNAAPYVDVRGATTNRADTVLTTAGAFDTVSVGNIETCWAHLTITHTGSNVYYGVHADTPIATLNPETMMVDCAISSASKAALGIGTAGSATLGGSKLWFQDCQFTHTGTSSNGCVFAHNAVTQAAATSVVFDNCTAVDSATGPSNCYIIQEYNSGQADKFYWYGGSVHAAGGGYDVDFPVATNYITRYMSTTAWSTKTGQTPTDIAGQVLPVPTRQPTR